MSVRWPMLSPMGSLLSLIDVAHPFAEWFERVPSASNPVDLPSRGTSSELRALLGARDFGDRMLPCWRRCFTSCLPHSSRTLFFSGERSASQVAQCARLVAAGQCPRPGGGPTESIPRPFGASWEKKELNERSMSALSEGSREESREESEDRDERKIS